MKDAGYNFSESNPNTSKAIGIRRFLSRSIILMSAVFLGLGVIGWVAEPLLERRDAKRFPPPGVLVDVGKYRMHINCTGSGDVPIILISGLSGWSQDWSVLQPRLTKSYRVCSYDRAGYGWSDEAPLPRSGADAMADLHRALDRAGVASPRVVVGHSLGGLLAQIYAKRYTQDVAGLVLVDSVEPLQYEMIGLATLGPYKRRMSMMGQAGVMMSRLGVMRAAKMPSSLVIDRLSPEQRPSAMANGVRTKAFRAFRDEFAAVDTALVQAADGQSPHVFPTEILATNDNRDFPPGWDTARMKELWAQAQVRLGRSWSDVPTIVDDASHYLQIDHPDLVEASISQVYSRITRPAALR